MTSGDIYLAKVKLELDSPCCRSEQQQHVQDTPIRSRRSPPPSVVQCEPHPPSVFPISESPLNLAQTTQRSFPLLLLPTHITNPPVTPPARQKETAKLPIHLHRQRPRMERRPRYPLRGLCKGTPSPPAPRFHPISPCAFKSGGPRHHNHGRDEAENGRLRPVTPPS